MITWRMRIKGQEEWIPAAVPGSVYNDLLNSGLMKDPYWRDNELQALALMDNDFEYEGSFDYDLSDEDEVILRFEGVDTIADISLNGQFLSHVDDMHRTYEFNVKDMLKPAGNVISVVFFSPTRFIREEYEKDPLILGTEDAMKGFPHLRKAHYMFGWDWGPRLPDAGLWRDVTLVPVRKARFVSVLIRQKISDDYSSVELIPETSVQKFTDGGCKVRIDTPIIDQPKLWWPNNAGEQNLYPVKVTLEDEGGVVLDSWERKIGIRKIEISNAADEFGKEFCFVVNGKKLFAMGADYIPEDNILPRMNRSRTRELIAQCRAANFNSIRVWGGGLYPSDDFYEACDEAGLIVWQDMMFACANYRLTVDFKENIEAEIRDNVRRIRHHASLGLLCGNNEMEMFVKEGEWGAHADPKIREDYLKMYEEIFPAIMREEAPDTFYWPASPSSGGGFDEPNSPDRGDVHYWDVWHGSKPFTEYRKFYFRFLSEFGFQSFPSLKTIETFTLPEDRNVFSYVMEKHQRNASANGKIMNYMEQTFLYPNDFCTLIYASQLLQAEAIRYGVEHLRRNRGRCMGAVYWQLNDCWPVASWSSIDYFGRWKALHYYARRFFAPVMISCEEEGLLTQNMNTNAEPFDVRKSIRLNVTNESMSSVSGKVTWELRDARGNIKKEASELVSVDALSSKWLDRVELPGADVYEDHVSFRFEVEGEIVSQGTVLFAPPKHVKFVDPVLTVHVEGDEIEVSAKAYCRSVQISNGNDDLLLDDNYFDMDGGTRRVKIISGSMEGLSVRSVYDIK